MKEREISLVDLLFEVLLRWRGIILLMLVGGICIGGIGYVRSVEKAEAERTEAERLEAQRVEALKWQQEQDEEWSLLKDEGAFLQQQLTATQITNVKSAIMYEGFYEDELRINEHSVIMKFDPYMVPKAETIFFC